MRIRISPVTVRHAAVACVAAAWLAFAGVLRPAGADETADATADLRLAARASAPVEDRLHALARVFERGVLRAGALLDPDAALRAAGGLVAFAPASCGMLARRVIDEGEARPDPLAAFAAAASAALDTERDPRVRADLAACRVLVGDRSHVDALFGVWPLPAFTASVVQDDAPEILEFRDPARAHPDARAAREEYAEHASTAALLDQATADDPAVARRGLDALRAAGARSFTHVFATAGGWWRGAYPSAHRPTPKGRVPRRIRAILLLGAAGRVRGWPEPSTRSPLFLVGLVDPDGWVRVASAYALGDLGEPAAAPALCRVLAYAGDIHRPRDSWNYPGVGNTEVSPEAWPDVEYYAIDEGAADALLRLGVRNAAGWLIEERLSPRSGRWRIRVLQDACDAIRRAFPDAPRDYEPDAGLPQREAAYRALAKWWKTGPRLTRPIDETNPGFRTAADHVARALVGKSVLEIQTATKVAVLLGPALTPSLVATLANADSRFARMQLATAFGLVRDPRAVEPLLRLTQDSVPQVRANAAESLAPYVSLDASVLPRLLALLDDPEAGPRTSAVKALVAAPPSELVAKAIDAHAPAVRPENDFPDYRLAEEVVRLCQRGEGLDTVAERLADPDLFHRRTVWELLRTGLDLEADLFDPVPPPGSPGAKPLDPAALRAALAKRRGS